MTIPYGWHWIEEEIHDPYRLWAAKDVDVTGEVAWLIEREMKNRGFTMVKENPDVLIIFQFAVDLESLAVVKRNTPKNGLRVETVPQGAPIVTPLRNPVLVRVRGRRDQKTAIPRWARSASTSPSVKFSGRSSSNKPLRAFYKR